MGHFTLASHNDALLLIGFIQSQSVVKQNQIKYKIIDFSIILKTARQSLPRAHMWPFNTYIIQLFQLMLSDQSIKL